MKAFAFVKVRSQAQTAIYSLNTIGKKHGFIYEGMFKDGQFDGKGTCNWTDNRVYEGSWKQDERNGQGEMTWPDGRDYKGFWTQDERDGQGEMTWPDGRYYKGNWKMGK